LRRLDRICRRARHRLRLGVRQGVHRRARTHAHLDRDKRDLQAQVHRRGGVHRRRPMARGGGDELQRALPRSRLHAAAGPARQGNRGRQLHAVPGQVQAAVQGDRRCRARDRPDRHRERRGVPRRGARGDDPAVRHENRRGHGQGTDQGTSVSHVSATRTPRATRRGDRTKRRKRAIERPSFVDVLFPPAFCFFALERLFTSRFHPVKPAAHLSTPSVRRRNRNRTRTRTRNDQSNARRMPSSRSPRTSARPTATRCTTPRTSRV